VKKKQVFILFFLEKCCFFVQMFKSVNAVSGLVNEKIGENYWITETKDS